MSLTDMRRGKTWHSQKDASVFGASLLAFYIYVRERTLRRVHKPVQQEGTAMSKLVRKLSRAQG